MNAKTYSMPYGFMVVWDKVDDAARYIVHLSIAQYSSSDFTLLQKQEIKIVDVERNKLYYTFNDLAYISKVEERLCESDIPLDCQNYLVFIEAEGKDGNIVEKSEEITGLIKYTSLTYNGGFTYVEERNWRKK